MLESDFLPRRFPRALHTRRDPRLETRVPAGSSNAGPHRVGEERHEPRSGIVPA